MWHGHVVIHKCQALAAAEQALTSSATQLASARAELQRAHDDLASLKSKLAYVASRSTQCVNSTTRRDAAGTREGPPDALVQALGRASASDAAALAVLQSLFERQGDPQGERYAVAQVLCTMRRPLHALFLHYCMLGGYDAQHWPPRMALPAWAALLRDAGVAASQRDGRRRYDLLSQQNAQRVDTRQTPLNGTAGRSLGCKGRTQRACLMHVRTPPGPPGL